MENIDRGPAPGQNSKSEEIFSDKNTELKVHRHLSDINDVITDQDLKNVKTDFNEELAEGPGGNEPPKEPEKGDPGNENNDKITEEKENKSEDAQHIITPWDILG